MSGTTPTWGLTYTTGGDALCDYGPVYISALAAELEAIFTNFNTTLNRLLAVPYTSISASTPGHATAIGSNIPAVTFDTVNADNYSWTNLAVAPSIISPASPTANGSYIMMALNAQILIQAGATWAQIELLPVLTAGWWAGNFVGTAVGAGGTVERTFAFANTTPVQQYFAVIGDPNDTQLPVPGYTAYAMWMSDIS